MTTQEELEVLKDTLDHQNIFWLLSNPEYVKGSPEVVRKRLLEIVEGGFNNRIDNSLELMR